MSVEIGAEIERLGGGRGWVREENLTTFCSVAEQLMLHGIGEDEVLDALALLYEAVADEYREEKHEQG